MFVRFALVAFFFLLPGLCRGSDLELMVFLGINAIRGSHGLAPLAHEPRLKSAARAQCLWMASAGRMEHLQKPAESFDEFLVCDHHPSNRVVKAGYFAFEDLFGVDRTPTGTTVYPKPAANEKVGEIIAKGWEGDDVYDAERVLAGWMDSHGHRQQITNPSFRDMGVAVCSTDRGESYWCVVFAFR